MLRLFRMSLLLLILPSFSGYAGCINNIKHLNAEELESYGIGIQVLEPVRGATSRFDMRLQPEVCVKTDEKGCSLATYIASNVVLHLKSSSKTIVMDKPNQYEYFARFELNRSEIAAASVEIIYFGERCDPRSVRQQHFFFNLKDIPASR